ncbi:hypothetical protein RF11_15157 [Thelohanellus kitauei]|uniref:Reverse transcriptase domain-containing protein n=1 Tax=Thelohanellus kitauei TaxID=669202 RepID=A0A0C2NH05_THEKT|nr:hypothetical protein RF11_15157 [Thelohanellus kitauei]
MSDSTYIRGTKQNRRLPFLCQDRSKIRILADSDKSRTHKKMAFSLSSEHGVYELMATPFGLTGGHGTFQRLTNSLLGGMPFVWVYLDQRFSTCCPRNVSRRSVVNPINTLILIAVKYYLLGLLNNK